MEAPKEVKDIMRRVDSLLQKFKKNQTKNIITLFESSVGSWRVFARQVGNGTSKCGSVDSVVSSARGCAIRLKELNRLQASKDSAAKYSILKFLTFRRVLVSSALMNFTRPSEPELLF